MRRLTVFLPLLLATFLAACEEGSTLVQCDPMLSARASVQVGGGPRHTTVAPPTALLVEVVDDVTGQDLSAGASGSFVSGTRADSLQHTDGPVLIGYGSAGRYSVVVQHPGYAPWGADDVHVAAGECGPDTEEITARLRRVAGQ